MTRGPFWASTAWKSWNFIAIARARESRMRVNIISSSCNCNSGALSNGIMKVKRDDAGDDSRQCAGMEILWKKQQKEKSGKYKTNSDLWVQWTFIPFSEVVARHCTREFERFTKRKSQLPSWEIKSSSLGVCKTKQDTRNNLFKWKRSFLLLISCEWSWKAAKVQIKAISALLSTLIQCSYRKKKSKVKS